MCIECKCEEHVITFAVVPSEGALEAYVHSEQILDLSDVSAEDFNRDYWFVEDFISTGFRTVKYPAEVQCEYIIC